MECLFDDAAQIIPVPINFCLDAEIGTEKVSAKQRIGTHALIAANSRSIGAINLKPEQYIGFQMSYIPEQKGVFVYQNDGVYYITVLVDKRDLELNRRIFERERSIMHFYRQFRFD